MNPAPTGKEWLSWWIGLITGFITGLFIGLIIAPAIHYYLTK
jgi:hypothetical protein